MGELEVRAAQGGISVLRIPRMLFDQFGKNPRTLFGYPLADFENGMALTLTEGRDFSVLKVWYHESRITEKNIGGKVDFDNLFCIHAGYTKTGQWGCVSGNELKENIYWEFRNSNWSLFGEDTIPILTLLMHATVLAQSNLVSSHTFWEVDLWPDRDYSRPPR